MCLFGTHLSGEGGPKDRRWTGSGLMEVGVLQVPLSGSGSSPCRVQSRPTRSYPVGPTEHRRRGKDRWTGSRETGYEV